MRLEGVRDAWLKRAADERREPARDVTERMLSFQRDCEARAAAQVRSSREGTARYVESGGSIAVSIPTPRGFHYCLHG